MLLIVSEMCVEENSFSHQKPDVCRAVTQFPTRSISIQSAVFFFFGV